MHLAQLELGGFRSLANTRVTFRRGVTVLVGENSSGKTAVIDALRMVTDPIDGKRSMWADVDDLSRPIVRQSFELGMTLKGSPAELAPYSDAHILGEVAGDEVTASYRMTHQPPSGRESRGLTTWMAGSGAVQDAPDPKARTRIRHVYLPPLRDAVRELGPAGTSRIRGIVERFLDDKQFVDELGVHHDEARFLADVGAHLDQVAAHPVLKKVSETVNEPLATLTRGVHEHVSDLGFGRADLTSLVRGLWMRMADAGVEPRHLAESGLGYANLAYVATVLTHLHAASQADLTLLLVEEPEAHLHPQLQAVLLDYLASAADDSQSSVPSGDWLGRIQVVVTTHAPLLAAQTDVADIVVMKRRRLSSSAGQVGLPESGPASALFSADAIAVGELNLAADDLGKINRYLDATRSSLLFGARTLLVEGIAEAILVPAFARKILSGKEWSKFVGSTIVAIDGVDFGPYLRLLLTQGAAGRIGQRLAVLTDLDPGRRSDPVSALHRVIEQLNAPSLAEVFASSTTLEPELLEAGNLSFWPAWQKQRPTAGPRLKDRIDSAPDPDTRARWLIAAMKKSRVRKGDFAQDLLAISQSLGHELKVPEYIAGALRWLVADE